MTDDRLPLAELMAKTGDGDFLRSVAESVLQIIMEADVDGLIGAGRHERSGERSTWRNGYRDRTLDTRLGTLNLKIPKLRTGAYFPGFLEPRKTVEKALVAVIQEAWIAGVSTRRVDELVQAMGMTGISKSSVSKLCKDIDERVHAFLKRPLAGDWPYLWLDATYLKVREGEVREQQRHAGRCGDDDRLRRRLVDDAAQHDADARRHEPRHEGIQHVDGVGVAGHEQEDLPHGEQRGRVRHGRRHPHGCGHGGAGDGQNDHARQLDEKRPHDHRHRQHGDDLP